MASYVIIWDAESTLKVLRGGKLEYIARKLWRTSLGSDEFLIESVDFYATPDEHETKRKIHTRKRFQVIAPKDFVGYDVGFCSYFSQYGGVPL